MSEFPEPNPFHVLPLLFHLCRQLSLLGYIQQGNNRKHPDYIPVHRKFSNALITQSCGYVLMHTHHPRLWCTNTLFAEWEWPNVCTQGQWMEIHPPLTPSGWLSWPGSSRAEHRTWPLLQEERGWLSSDNTFVSCRLHDLFRCRDWDDDHKVSHEFPDPIPPHSSPLPCRELSLWVTTGNQKLRKLPDYYQYRQFTQSCAYTHAHTYSHAPRMCDSQTKTAVSYFCSMTILPRTTCRECWIADSPLKTYKER